MSALFSPRPTFFLVRSMSSIIVLAVCMVLAGPVGAQETDKDMPEGFVSAESDAEDGLRKEIEPGVIVFGKSHRFAEVGASQAFDSSPDGRTVVFASNKLKFFDLRENKVRDEVGEPGDHYSGVLYSPDGRYVFAQTHVDGQTIVRVFDAIDLSLTGSVGTRLDDEQENHHFYIQQMAVSPDAKYVAVASHNELQIRKVATGELVYRLDQLGYVQGMGFSPDELEFYIPNNGKLVVIDLETGEPKKRSASKLVNQRSGALAVSLSRSTIALPQTSSVTIFDLRNNESLGSIQLPKNAHAQKVDFSDDGAMIAVTAYQRSKGNTGFVVVVADVDIKKVVKTIKVSSQGITRARFSTGNESLYVSGHGIYGIQEIQLSGGDDEISKSKYPVGPAKQGLIHPDGKSFLTCSHGGEVTWFDPATGKVLRSIQKSNLRSASLTEDQSELILVTQWNDNDPIARHDYETGEIQKSYGLKAAAKKNGVFAALRNMMVKGGASENGHNQTYALAARLSEDGTELNSLVFEMNYRFNVTLGSTSTETETTIGLMKLDAKSGKQLAGRKFDTSEFGFAENSWVQQGDVNRDGSQLAIARDRTVYVIDTESGEAIAEYNMDGAVQVKQLEYSPQGNFLAAMTHQGLVVWDAATGEEVMRVKKLGNGLFSFSQDDSRMAFGSQNKSKEIDLFETDSWKRVLTRKNTQANRSSLTLSHDGKQLLIGLADCRVELWDFAKLSR